MSGSLDIPCKLNMLVVRHKHLIITEAWKRVITKIKTKSSIEILKHPIFKQLHDYHIL